MNGPLPLPPAEYMVLVSGGGPDLENNFLAVGRQLVQMLDKQEMLGPGVRLLDVGCGCGRLARQLAERTDLVYCGFDRHAGMIAWCAEHLTPAAPHLHFHHVAVRSAYDAWDREQGTQPVETVRFDFPEAPFSAALLSSVFTHMPLDETGHYLRELHRVLLPAGRVLLSVMFTEGEPQVLQQLNFLYRPDDFAALAAQCGFAATPLNPRAYGLAHNWFLLQK